MYTRTKRTVSVLMITYNHEKFIAQAIESVLMQQADFHYELVIGEDCSTDRTRKIVSDCQRRHPDKIRLLLNKKNLGMIHNFVKTLQNCDGKYIALLEGDDYWTDPLKLQKQVNFLDNNPEFVICFHRTDFLDQESGKIIHGGLGPPISKPYYTVDDLFQHCNFMPTCSVVFKNNLFSTFPDWYYEVGVGDFPLHILNASHGEIGFIDESMTVYRKHPGGLYGGQNLLENCERRVQMYLLLGDKLSLNKRVSYHLGVLNQTVNLCRAYWEAGNGVNAIPFAFKAFFAGFKALIYASYNRKVQTLRQLCIILTPNILKKIIHSMTSHSG